MTLPPIHEWWPHLSVEARHEVIDDGSPHLGEKVREEIRQITGAVVGVQESLSAEDVEYARTQIEQVD
ncbi:hypothetical protein [Microbacterium sp. 179-I 3D4 NHS]|uniref:hypothetical protein n=1 Tax=Microbacterium sp. 179-I 3D4 NHS TaxID=3142381 RepID=UPI00399F81DE